MRKTTVCGIVLVMIAMIFATVPVNVSAEGACPDGLVAYWKFDEGSGTIAYDSIGDNDGKILGATWTTGQVGGALSFDGWFDYVEVPDSADLDITDELTIEAWIFPVIPNPYASIIVTKMTSYGYYPRNYQLGISGSGDRYQFCTTGCTWSKETSTQLYQWNHIATTYDGSTVSFYVNGNFVESKAFYYGMAANDFSLTIGGDDYWIYNGYKGSLDEVAIWDKVLGLEEIQRHYQNGLEGKGYCEEFIEATVDIGPEKLNLKSKGKWVSGYIELPDGYDVNDIDVSTVKISKAGDTAVDISAEGHPSSIGDNDCDGIPDLMVKFSRPELIAAMKNHEHEPEIEMVIEGELDDGTEFQECGRWIYTGAGWKWFCY
ncbi:MAG: LamG domain-containing protein [Thermoplasmata archaeon]|nr:MAG: LamG domain-containing protein [Thermoplasmata archaeon]